MAEDVILPDNAGIVDTFQRARASDGATVNMQAVVPVDPATGDPLQLAQQATLLTLNTAVGTLNAAAAAIQVAVEAMNGKTTAVNTGAIAGTVALDGYTLAALESISVATGLAQPVTDAQLRASAVPVSGAFYPATQPVSADALPLPSGAATESTLAAVDGKLPALSGGRIPVVLPAGGGGLTDSELRASAVPVSIASLPLPAGAATNATLAALEALLTSLAGTVKNHNDVFVDGSPGQIMLAKRRDADTTAVADGDLNILNMDEAGRLKVATQPGSISSATGSITANGQNVSILCGRFGNLSVSMVATSLVGHNVSFECSNNSTNGTDGNWYSVQAVRSNAQTVEVASGVLAATPAYMWHVNVGDYSYFRVRATAHTSGTAAYILKPGSFATEPIPAVQVTAAQPISGSVTATLAAATVRAGFVAGAGIWYDDSAVALAAAASFTGTSRDLTVTATATAFANAATYAKELRVSAESDQSGTLWLEVSRDNTNWRRVKSVATAAIAGGGQYAEIIHRPSWRYARVGFTNGATLQTRFSIGSLAVAL